MIDEPQPDPPRKNNFPSRLVFFLLALLPVPLGLITIDPESWMTFTIEEKKPWSSYELFFAIMTVLLCTIGCAGMLHERGKKDWDRMVVGVFVGLILAFVEVHIMAFFGCCYAISQI